MTSLSESEQPAILDLQQVSCAYDRQNLAIQQVTLSAKAGEIICLLGPSGCGKTTTLRAIAGFEPVIEGTITIQGKRVSGLGVHFPPEKRHIGMVFQDYALFPHMRVAENIGFGLTHMRSSERQAQITRMLSLIGLTGLERRYPHELSGGQQQRVALARALAPRPVLLLLDEPFSNLDPDMTLKMRNELHRLLRETNTTTVLVTHDHDEAFAMADRIAVFQEGRLLQFDTPETIYHLPASPFVAEFAGQADFLPGTLRQGVAMTEIGEFPRLAQYNGHTEVMVLVRPDDIRITGVGTGTALIEARQFHGSENLYTIRLPSGAQVHCSEPSTVVYPVNSPVELQVIATHTVLFERSGI